MSETLGQKKDKYGKLLLVSADGTTADFSFTKTKFVALEKIVDEFTRLDYEFAVHDRVTKRTMIYKGDQPEKEILDFDVFLDPGCNKLFHDARKRSENARVDVLLFHASEKHAFIYQIDGMDDFDEYTLMFDESDVEKSSMMGTFSDDYGTTSRQVERSTSCPVPVFDGFADVEVKDASTREFDYNKCKKFEEYEKKDLHQVVLQRQ